MSFWKKLFGRKEEQKATPPAAKAKKSEPAKATSSNVGKVSFLREEKRPAMQGLSTLATYRYYKAVSTEAALEFLNKQEVSQNYFYVCVETPDGRWVKDRTGMYDA